MVDKKTTDKKPAEKAAASKGSAKSSAKSEPAKKVAAVAPEAKAAAAAKGSASKTSTAGAITPKPVPAGAAKAGAIKEGDMKSAAKKISALDKAAANNAIRSKKSVDDLKSRAHEAKQRAQRKILEKAYVSDKPTDPLERLANTFDSSAKRWEMVVYPSLFAFVLLAGYGFFLIYRLTHDIAILSQSVTHMAVIVSDAMPRMTKDLGSMTGSIDNMTGNIDGMTTEIGSMSTQMDSLTPMSNNIQSMTHNIGNMNRSVYGMQRDMHGMNRTVSSGPFGMMNDVMPFSSDTNVPPAMPPPQTWGTYNGQPQRNAYYTRPYQPARLAPVKQAKAAPPQKPVRTEVTMPGASPVSLKDVSSPKSSVTVQDETR
jgi:uncharacterized protein YoxC